MIIYSTLAKMISLFFLYADVREALPKAKQMKADVNQFFSAFAKILLV